MSHLENAKTLLEDRIGEPTEPTEWFEITQERINLFAEATLDDQWIHVDVDRAKKSPYGGTIAHGQLTLSIMACLPGAQESGLPELEGMKMAINYGWNKVRFPAPVPTGSFIRMRREIKAVLEKGPMLEVITELTAEVKGQDKPACVGESVLRFVF